MSCSHFALRCCQWRAVSHRFWTDAMPTMTIRLLWSSGESVWAPLMVIAIDISTTDLLVDCSRDGRQVQSVQGSTRTELNPCFYGEHNSMIQRYIT